MYYGFEWWWIFPLACLGLMLLGMILFSRKGRGFCCRLPKGWSGPKDRIGKMDQETHNPIERQNKTGD